jgi:HAD superfamily hydrolase (TIGR01459 family)
MPNTKFCHGISDISDSYTGFLIDTWGVLHTNEALIDGAVECLKELRARKKFVILLSNTEARADQSSDFLKKIGLTDGLYDAIMTSGELAYQGFKTKNETGFENLGDQCFLIGGTRTEQFLKSIPIDVVSDVQDASFLMIGGWDHLDTNVAQYDDVLRQCVRKRLKAICINPDSRSLFGTNYITGTGQIARRYQEFGGVVQYIGKPYKPIYYQCIKILHQNDIYPGQTVMVGDSMAHDILGASMMNMDTCLVRNGMHASAFKNATTPADVNKMLNILIAQYNQVRPTYLVDRLKWGRALPDRKHKRKS